MSNAYLLGLYEKSMPNDFTLARKLATARETGYDYLELSIDETEEKLARLDWTSSAINALRRDTEATGVPIKSICLSAHRRFPLGDPDPDARAKAFDITEKAVVLAAQLGVRIIQLAGYDVYYKPSSDETRLLFGEGLARSVEMAAKHGVTLAFETMETPFMDTVEKAMAWVRAINSPYLQVYPDLGNLTNAALLYTSDVRADLARGAGHLAAMHLKETQPGIYREVAYGSGHVAFESGIATAWELGVRMFVGEFWHLGETDVPATLKSNNHFLRQALDQSTR